ncbi:MAG: hypothetical protein M1812_002591 [Candelaria pacifica]|nr:MAG: hypothetical protein M1812_002591 [Candelaria pacifica]
MESPEPEQTPYAAITAQTSRVGRIYQAYLDKSTPFVTYRWIGTGAVLLAFMLRIVIAQGWYIVAYSLGIYLLNLFLAFLQPKFDPSIEQDEGMEDGSAGGLPTKKDEEFRPFIRRLPEFKFCILAGTGVLLVDTVLFDDAETDSAYDKVQIRALLVREDAIQSK